jgi:hypothetical protein
MLLFPGVITAFCKMIPRKQRRKFCDGRAFVGEIFFYRVNRVAYADFKEIILQRLDERSQARQPPGVVFFKARIEQEVILNRTF